MSLCLLRRRAGAAITAVLLIVSCTLPARATNTSAFLSGTIIQNGAPVAGADVRATGNNRTYTTKTDRHGYFQFPPASVGTYTIEASHGDAHGSARVDLATGGAVVTIPIGLKEIGNVVVRSTNQVRGSGSDTVLDKTSLTEMPYNQSFTEMMLQLPGSARGANGVVHFNGDHGVINYQLDGVMLPQELNRDIGGEIDLNDLSFVDFIAGAYPAQYGLKFGALFNMSTRAGTGPAGLDGNASYGSYGTVNTTVGYHAPLAGGGGYDIAFSGMQTDRGLDPPDFDSPHNEASSVDQFARFTLPGGANNYTNVTFVHSTSTYQIPNDVQFGEPADTDDNENQEDTFLALQFHHAIGNNGAFNFGPAIKSSTIQDFGDPNNDFIYGESLNVTPPPFGNGVTSTDCANAFAVAPTNPTAFPTMCGYSLNDKRTALDYILQGDYTRTYGRHTFQSGATYDNTRVDKYYAITLQPDNFLAPVLTPGTPDAPTTVVDDAPNEGNTYSFYAQDSWRISSIWEADYGMRYDFFNIRSTSFDDGFGAFSPRLKITRFWGTRASLYAYIGRFFEPFSFENVSPQAAQLLNLPLQPTVAQFDLKPERDTDLEIGGHLPLGAGDLGFRVWQKNANDLIDDTQVGVTLLHQDINYVLGRISQEALVYSQPLAHGARAYIQGTHENSVNDGCETQLLAPCFGQPTGYTPADHEQRWSISGGVLLRDQRGGWFSMDSEYGSGLSSNFCEPPELLCKETPHTIFNLEKGIAIAPKTALTFNISNLLNDRYYVTLLNAQGNHYAPPREFSIGVRFSP
jgi:hypothetical protein